MKARLDLAVSDLGATELKNIAEPMRVYSLEVGRTGASEALPRHCRRRSATASLHRGAALRQYGRRSGAGIFRRWRDREPDHGPVAHQPASFVIGRNTAFTYKGKAVDLKQIGRELGVRYVLEGSVQRGGNRMRVNVQLIDAETGAHLWAERFDKPVADLFDMQDEIVARLANQLGTQLIAAEARRAERAPHPDSMDLYFQGLASAQ